MLTCATSRISVCRSGLDFAAEANRNTETVVDLPLKTTDAGISVVPANEASRGDLATVFGTRGEGFQCQCQRYKLQPREAFAHFPAQVRADRLCEQTHCGQRAAATTSGLVAYRDGEPVGWCAVEPRAAYPGLLRVYRVPWIGRAEDKNDTSIWAVTCSSRARVFAGAGSAVPLLPLRSNSPGCAAPAPSKATR